MTVNRSGKPPRDLSRDEFEIALARNGFRYGPHGCVIDDRAGVAVRLTGSLTRRCKVAYAIRTRERILSPDTSRSLFIRDDVMHLRAESHAVFRSEKALRDSLVGLADVVVRFRRRGYSQESLALLEMDLVAVTHAVRGLRRLDLVGVHVPCVIADVRALR